MISGSAAFLALEAAAQGGFADPVFLARFSPWLLPPGIAGGTFTNSTLVPPAKIEVNEDAATASWESADLSSDFESYPRTWVVSWIEDLTGYELTSAQYKTAETQAGLAGASYQNMGNGEEISLYRWYKLKFSFTGYKSLATDTGLEFPARQAQASDAGTGYGLAIDGSGNGSTVDEIELSGEWPVKEAEIESCGEIPLEEPRDFSDLVSGDHTLRLMDPDNIYNPYSTDFLYYGQNWYGRTMSVFFGYRKPGTRNIELLTEPIFEGKVINWDRIEPGENGVPRAQIYARDWMAELLKTPLGKPDSDGNPNPVVTGTVVAEAKQVFDIYPSAPEGDIDFETGDFSQISGYEALGGGAVSIVSANPLYGLYSARTAVSGASQTARLRLKPLVNSGQLLFRGWFKINTMPTTPGDKLTRIMSLWNDTFGLYVGTDTRLYVYYNATYNETDCYLGSYEGFRVKFDFGLLAANPGLIRVRIQGNEILSEQADFSASTASTAGFWFGPVTGAGAETWQIDWDRIQFWPKFAPLLYQVPGYPYQAIEAVYQDCLKVQKKEVQSITEMARQVAPMIGQGFSITQTTKVTPANYDASLTYGTIEFNYPDWYAVPPRGTVMARVQKNTVTHPVDVADYLIALRGLSSRINAASFAAALALIPSYSVGCWFENTTYGDALRALCQSCLLILAMDRGQFFLRAYTGAAPAGPVLDLTDTLIKNSADENFPFNNDEIIPKITVKWGWYEQNPDLYHEEINAIAQAQIENEDLQSDLDFSWGQPVASENSDMCIAIAQALLKRTSGRRNSPECEIFLKALRLELGDVVSRNAINYRVGRKELDGHSGVRLTLERYEGET